VTGIGVDVHVAAAARSERWRHRVGSRRFDCGVTQAVKHDVRWVGGVRWVGDVRRAGGVTRVTCHDDVPPLSLGGRVAVAIITQVRPALMRRPGCSARWMIGALALSRGDWARRNRMDACLINSHAMRAHVVDTLSAPLAIRRRTGDALSGDRLGTCLERPEALCVIAKN
jgi:hypothetical protein